jgi:hypothetical protein
MKLLSLAVSTFCVLATVSSQANGKEWEFKGFEFGRTTFSQWEAAVHQTARDLSGETVTVAPYCSEQGRYEDQAEAAVGVKRCSWWSPSASDTSAGVAAGMLQIGEAGANTDEWVFLDGVLAQFSATLYVTQLHNFLPALIAKYGTPVIRIQKVQNAFGAQFTNEIYEWHLGTMVIVVRKYLDRLDEAGITISNPISQQKLEARLKLKHVSTKGL